MLIELKKQDNWNCDSSGAFSMASISSISDASCENASPETTASLRRLSSPKRRSSKSNWTEEEDKILADVVQEFNGKTWKKIAEHIPGRTDVQCLHRWQKVLDPNLVKGAWTKEEDEQIVQLVKEQGSNRKWSLIAKSLPGRIGKQCRERWFNHLDPAIKRDAWTAQEESILAHCQKIYGNKWANIARFLPGRTDNAIKNHWNCSLKKRLGSTLHATAMVDTYRISPDVNDSQEAANMTEVVQMIRDSIPVDCELRLHSGVESTSQNDVPLMTKTNSGSLIQPREAISTGADTRSQDFDGSFLSLSPFTLLEVDAQSKKKKDRRTSPTHEVEVQEIAEEVRVPLAKDSISKQTLNLFSLSSPESTAKHNPAYSSSPELVLRNSALNFSAPSIMRKKRRYEVGSSLDNHTDTPPSLIDCHLFDSKCANKQEAGVTRIPQLSRRLFSSAAYELEERCLGAAFDEKVHFAETAVKEDNRLHPTGCTSWSSLISNNSSK